MNYKNYRHFLHTKYPIPTSKSRGHKARKMVKGTFKIENTKPLMPLNIAS